MSRGEPIRVQVLGPTDLALLRALNALFAEVFEDRESYAGRPPSDDYLRRVLSGDTTIAIVALAGAQVVGGLTGYELRKLEQERSEVYLYDLAVSAQHRRQGIATALIRRLQQEATARGAWVVFVQADHGDDPAIALYTKLGTREDVLHFDLDATGTRPANPG
jgi:aminoglycoside 3-N-acetyltransferase I